MIFFGVAICNDNKNGTNDWRGGIVEFFLALSISSRTMRATPALKIELMPML